MKKGVILSVNKFSITLLTPDGEFDKSRRLHRNYEIGEEIFYKPVENPLKPFLNFPGNKTAVISAVVTCIMFLSIVIPQFSTQVSAYMTIDVNPSIELGLDDELKVVELRGINADGKRVISQIHGWKNQDVSNIAEEIVLKTKELGYITDSTKKIIVSKTVIEQDEKLDKKLDQEIKGLTKGIKVANTEVKLLNATENDRNKAKQQGISTGKFVEQQREQKRKEDESSLKKKSDNQGNGNTTSVQNQKVSNNNQTNETNNHKYVKNHDRYHNSNKSMKNHQKDKNFTLKNNGNYSEDKRKLRYKEYWKNKDNQKNEQKQKINSNAVGIGEKSEIKSNQRDKKENSSIKNHQRDKKENSSIKNHQRDKKENSHFRNNQKNKNEHSKVKGNSGNNKKNSENKSKSRSKEKSDNNKNSSNNGQSKGKEE